MSNVFVLDTNKQQLNPVHPGRARLLLSAGKASVFKRYPFTIILKSAVEKPEVQPLRIKIDPGSRTTGVAIINDTNGEVVFAAELSHRGVTIKASMDDRRAVRRSRRNRKIRHRKARWQNRKRSRNWLPPSLESRIANILTWVNRLRRLAPIIAISQELVKFDLQKMQNPEISGVEYQQGELAGYEVREYLLEKWKRTCAYCGTQNVPLQVEHIHAKTNGGTNRVSNLCLACKPCNQAKGKQNIRIFLANKPEVLKHILTQIKAPLKDAAAVNTTRWALFNRLKNLGLPMEVGSGGLTKFNRTTRELPKEHWIDAACVGKSTPEQIKITGVVPLLIIAKGHGTRQMCQTNKYGFPRYHRQRRKQYFGFRTGDIARAMVSSGRYAGTYVARVTVRANGGFKLRLNNQKIFCNHKYCTVIHRNDGYDYKIKDTRVAQ